MQQDTAADQQDNQGNDTNHGRAAFSTGSTTGGGSNYGQGSHNTGGSPYRQGTVQGDGANYESEADRLGASTTGTRMEGSQSDEAGAPGSGAQQATHPDHDTGAEAGATSRSPVNLAEDDQIEEARDDQEGEVRRKKGS